MANYAFGAGGFQLGERVEILTTGQRGILISEVVHISGCNTYQVLLPSVLAYDNKVKTTQRDHLVLRKLEPSESLFDGTEELTDENTFSPKGIDVNAEWIRAAVDSQKECIPEIDDAVGVEEITIQPGMEVWNKIYSKAMVINLICRDIYAKELTYGAVYMDGDKEVIAFSNVYALIPLEQKFELPPADKQGSIFDDGRSMVESRDKEWLTADIIC